MQVNYGKHAKAKYMHRAAFNSDGFQNKWMANVFKTSRWPMLLILADANAFNTSEAYNGGALRPSEGRRPHLGNPLYAPLVLKALASASIKSIGHPLVLKALAIHLFLKPPATTCFKSFPGDTVEFVLEVSKLHTHTFLPACSCGRAGEIDFFAFRGRYLRLCHIICERAHLLSPRLA